MQVQQLPIKIAGGMQRYTARIAELDGLMLCCTQLQDLGVNAASIGFNTLTLESDRFICAREKVNDTSQVVIVDLLNNNGNVKTPITADSVIMHPTEKIMALKGG